MDQSPHQPKSSAVDAAPALRIRVRGIVQGVGFRPFVYRIANAHQLVGWVRNDAAGVEIRCAGQPADLAAFVKALREEAPPAARVDDVAAEPAMEPLNAREFIILESARDAAPTTRISPDLATCDDCLRELRTPADRRCGYPYINCTNCGPRFSVIESLPYDRPRTTMKHWPLCEDCAREYHDPADRRFHAQPVACPRCGPQVFLEAEQTVVARGPDAIAATAVRLRDGQILGIKGLGGYHLACDARNAAAVARLRDRKFRKEKPFALMPRDLDVARSVVALRPEDEALLTGIARPIVLCRATTDLPGVAPDCGEFGVMLPYTPVHALLFDAGGPELLVMTSANRSSEPIAFDDDDARRDLAGIADALLIGERPIARRIDDSVAAVRALGPVILRRARGYSPATVARLPASKPVLAVGADLKNAITLVVDGEALLSQHIGDLDYSATRRAFERTLRDLPAMYDLPLEQLTIAHDAHPAYISTRTALGLPGERHIAVQHHRAHIASVLAERDALDRRVVGLALDGTGYGDDGAIWGGEVFVGDLASGLRRAAHLHPALLPGGDAAAQFPPQAAAGFLHGLEGLPDLLAPPFSFPDRFRMASQLVEKGVNCFVTTSTGRLFDCVAALLGFTREITFEGQAAIWLEQQANQADAAAVEAYPFEALDYRPMLRGVIADRVAGRPVAEIAASFHASVARGFATVAVDLAAREAIDTLVLSGGVFQNARLLAALVAQVRGMNDRIMIWTNADVPPNDGGISVGQAALAVMTQG